MLISDHPCRRLVLAALIPAIAMAALSACRLPGPVDRPEPSAAETVQESAAPEIKAGGEAPGNPLAAGQVSELAACMLRRLNTEWMFDQQVKRPLRFENKSIGLFLGGAQSVRYDSQLLVCAGELAGTNDRERKQHRQRYSHDDLQRDQNPPALRFGGYLHAISELANLPLYQKRPAAESAVANQDANYYNPELIRWAAANLIPRPDDTVYGLVSYRTIYERVLIRSARILARSYLQLQADGSFEKLTAEYAAGEQWSRQAMRDRLSDTLAPDQYSNDRYNLNFDAGHASAFWLRRGMDGTADEVWSLVEAALKQYDPQIVDAGPAR